MKLNAFIRRSLATLCLCFTAGTPAPLLAAANNAEKAEIAFRVLRVIYPAAEKKGVTLTAYNKAARPSLIQSLIRPVDPATGDVDLNDQSAMPFIVTPPLARLEGNSDLTLRIRRNEIPLPQDRESVFFVSLKAIPSQPAPDQGKESAVVLAVVNSLKVFYRPEGLEKRAVVDAAKELRFQKRGNQLVAVNPTPYWLTFSRLKIGQHALDKAQLRLMVPPKGERQYDFPESASGRIEWQLIDEDGWDTPVNRQD